MSKWTYDKWPSIYETNRCDWSPALRGKNPWDKIDFHVDLGCGRVPKARIGIDKSKSDHMGYQDQVVDFDTKFPTDWPPSGRILPFYDETIKSIITHHCLEHVGEGFERLMEECYRVLEWGGIMRIIVPAFPSHTSVAEYDHKRYFMQGTFEGFTGIPNGPQTPTDEMAEPYNTCRFKLLEEDITPLFPPELRWTKEDRREMRVTLWKWKGNESREAEPSDYGV